jgi:ABC-type transporter Mla MlaB component
MMNSRWDEQGRYSVQVEGSWTIDTVTAHLQQAAQQSLKISECALHFAESNPGARIVTEIDLSRIIVVDASGMRVLTLWLDHLQHQGFNPVVINQDGELCKRFAGNKYVSGKRS